MAYRTARVNDASPARLKQTKERLDAAIHNAERATLDLDATGTQQQKLDATLDSSNLSEKDRAALEGRRKRGEALRDARRFHTRAMPEAPDANSAPGASAAYDALGDKREQMAYVDARWVTADEKERERLTEQRQMMENDAFGLEVNYRVLAANGAPDLRYLSSRERSALRDAPDSLRRDAVYVSHLRSTFDNPTAGHPERLSAYVTDRSNRFQQELLGEVETAPGVTASGKDAGRGDGKREKSLMEELLNQPGHRRDKGGLVDGTLGVAEKFFDVQPGKRQGKPIIGGNVG